MVATLECDGQRSWNRSGRTPVVDPLEARRLLSAGFHAHSSALGPIVAGELLEQTIAVLNYPSGVAINPSVQINWGDGAKQTAPTYENSSTQVGVFAQHTYAHAGTYLARVTFFTGSKIAARVAHNITVIRNTANGSTIDVQTGQQLQRVLGTFVNTVTMGGATLKLNGVGIEWGDGTQEIGNAVSLGNNRYSVTGQHAYASPGTYHVRILAATGTNFPDPLPNLPGKVYPLSADFGQYALVIADTVRVSGPPVTLPPSGAKVTAPSSLVLYQGMASTPLATITGLPTGAYSTTPYAEVSWNDGTPTAFDVAVEYNKGEYAVTQAVPPPTVAAVTTEDAIVTVWLNDHTDPSQNTVLGVIHETFTVEPYSQGATVLHLTAGQPFSGSLGVLSLFPGQTPQLMTIQWGDVNYPTIWPPVGDPAMLTPLGNNQYDVAASHIYTAPGTYQIIGNVEFTDGQWGLFRDVALVS